MRSFLLPPCGTASFQSKNFPPSPPCMAFLLIHLSFSLWISPSSPLILADSFLSSEGVPLSLFWFHSHGPPPFVLTFRQSPRMRRDYDPLVGSNTPLVSPPSLSPPFVSPSGPPLPLQKMKFAFADQITRLSFSSEVFFFISLFFSLPLVSPPLFPESLP